MIKTSYQVPELRNANDEVVQEGAFGKNTALSNSTNDGWIDYVVNNLEAIHDTIGDSAATLDGNGHVVEPANLAIGDEDGNRLKTSYLKLTGGTVAGTLNVQQNLKMQDNQENVFGGLYVPASSASDQYLVLYGGESPASGEFGARLRLYGAGDGKFQLIGQKADGSTSYTLTCTDAGALTWRGNTLATLASPALTGNPTAPTQATNNNSTRLATTAYVVNDLTSNVSLMADALVDTIPSNADLDDYTTAGTYRCTSSSVAATITNSPITTSGFKLLVMQVGYGSSTYCMQLVFGVGRNIKVRSRIGTTSWGEWRSFAYAEGSLQLTGGTMTGAITTEAVHPASFANAPFRVQYTGITNGTAPASTRRGGLVACLDSDGENLGGVEINLSSNGSSEIRLIDRWGSVTTALWMGTNAAGTTRYAEPNVDNTITLGQASYRWKQLFAGTTTISTSDERLKTNIIDIPNDVLDAWGEVGWVQFQFTESVAEKGETYARVHTGAIAQRIKAVFEVHNLDPFRYGLLCYDEWDATPAERDEQGNITEPAKPAGNRYSLRYEEALCMEAAYQRRRADRLEERIARLEALMSE